MTPKPKTKPKWEREFERKFGFIGCGLCLKGTWLDERDFRGDPLFPNAKKPKDPQKEMINFIHQTINQEVKEALERVEHRIVEEAIADTIDEAKTNDELSLLVSSFKIRFHKIIKQELEKSNGKIKKEAMPTNRPNL